MKWYVQNFRGRIRFALRNPGYALRSVVRDLAHADENFLARATGARLADVSRYLNEPFEQAWFAGHLRNCEFRFAQSRIESASLYGKKVLLQYAVARALRPSVVLETGIASGVSSAYLLLALELNGAGTLQSLGDEDPGYLPDGCRAGWVVPENLSKRWKLHLGKAEELLPGLARSLTGMDLFIHDSLHTYEHMLFEFRAAYPHLRPGGILIADDASWNPAFSEFAEHHRIRHAEIMRGIGILKKPE